MTKINKSIISEHGISEDEFKLIKEILQREPNLLELGIFSVMWSEHCSYKSTKKWLKTLPTSGEKVICGPGENAGIIDIGDNQAVRASPATSVARISSTAAASRPSFSVPHV